jgi:hypothetical protein
MSSGVARSNTTRVVRSNTTRKAKKILDDVKQDIKTLYPLDAPDDDPADVDIVFVPGLGADPIKSWQSNTSDFNWILDKDGLVRDFRKARFLLYRYESAWLGTLKVKQYLANLSSTLLEGLKSKRDKGKCAQRPIVFIGHSMGGLVIAKAITIAGSRQDRFPYLFEAVAGCIFFGTPFSGAPAAAVASLFAKIGEKFDHATSSKLLELMKPEDAADSLRELKNDFVRLVGKLSQKIELYCFYEERETNFAQLSGLPANLLKFPKNIANVVSRESATLPGVEEMGLACIHRDLVKFDGPKDGRYDLVRGPLKDIINKAPLVARNRFASTRNINHETITAVMEVLGGAQVKKIRKALETKYTASSWLAGEQEYRDWVSTATDDDLASPTMTGRHGDCLWIRGPEGRGKTNNMLAALNEIQKMIDTDMETFPGQPPALLAYFFCEPTADYSTAEDLLKSLLWQLVSHQGMLATYAKHFVKKKDKQASSSTPQLTVENMWQVLQDMLSDDFIGSRVYFVINNLHALSEDADATINLKALLNSELRDLNIPNQRRVPVRWLFTSRKTHTIEVTLKTPWLRLIDLEDPKYGNQVQLELRNHAQKKVSALSVEKQYNKAAAYFASSLIGRRAQNTQWIDIACLRLNELPKNEKELKVRKTLEAMPQDLPSLLEQAWVQVFNANSQDMEQIKEMLRALVLTYEDPTESELCVLAGIHQQEEDKTVLRQLVEKCKPLLIVKRTSLVVKGTTQTEVKICFMDAAFKTHLLKNAPTLLGLSEEATARHHGVMSLRSFSHLIERLDFPEPEKRDLEPYKVAIGDDGDVGSDVESDDVSEDMSDSFVNEMCPMDDASDMSFIDFMDDWSCEDYDEDDSSDDEFDAEVESVKDIALAYMVKHWLHHASKATIEIAEGLSLEKEFWKPGSLIQRRWLIEYDRLTEQFKDFCLDQNSLCALHIAASAGFAQLVLALVKNGHQEELNRRDAWYNTPVC